MFQIINNMTRYFVLCVLILSSFVSFSQTKKRDIKAITEYNQSFEKGGFGKVIDRKYEYDERGNELKDSDYNKEGDLKRYTVCTYQGKSKLTEIEYDARGKVVRKTVNTYNDENLKITESEYDAKGTLVYKHVYSYNENGDRILRKTYNESQKLIKEKTYIYEYRND